jgi:hypothetical protein
MAARRLIIVMISLLVISSIAAALVPVERDALEDGSSTTTASRPAPTGKLTRETVTTGGKPARIRLRVGDQLELRVRVKRPDEVAIPRLGQLVAVDPAAPAYFDLLPDEPGTYQVRLVGASRTIARIHVKKRARSKPTNASS